MLYSKIFKITPDNTKTFKTNGIVVETTGKVLLVLEENQDPVYMTLNAGTVYPYKVKQILASYSFDGGVTTVTTDAIDIYGLI